MDSNPWLAYSDYHVLVLPDHTHLLLAKTAVKTATNTYSANTPASWEARRPCSTLGCSRGLKLPVCMLQQMPSRYGFGSFQAQWLEESVSRNYINPPPWSHLPWIKKFSQPYYVAIKPTFLILLASWATANETTLSSKTRQHTHS